MKCYILWSGVVAFAGALVVTTNVAQEKKESAPSAQEALLKKLATPGPHHRRLDALRASGNWP